MKTISIDYSRSSGLDGFFDVASKTMTVKDKSLGGGGFGVVYEVEAINKKKPSIPLVLKLFKEGKEANWKNVINFQEEIIKEVERLQNERKLFFVEYPALVAVPLLLVEGKMDGKIVHGYISYNLTAGNYISSEKVVIPDRTNPEEWKRHTRKDLTARYRMALCLAKSCVFLRNVHFIHADISPDNLFVNPIEQLVSLIDYDSGSIISSPEDRPTTIGKLCEWSAPEINFYLTNSMPDKIVMDATMDDWAISSAIHYILTGCQPIWTDNMSENTLRDYSLFFEKGKRQWPKLESGDSIYPPKKFERIYPFYLHQYEGLNEKVKLQFENTFTRGIFDRTFRTDARTWAEILTKLPQVKKEYEWKAFRKLLPEFPNIQSGIAHPLPQQWYGLLNKGGAGIVKSSESLKDYVNELIPDLINGSQKLSLHKPFILKMANESGKDGNKYLEELTDFLDLFKECVKDKKITRFEYNNMLLQAQLVGIEKNTLDKLLKPYKILK